ncbi:zona pellucida sperm-binding protein 1 [Antechinus flavipes]|uniref:zona pellucida sperm-binding protein 1 n=1 Tax=Antechinus flavipes TaxID=38775 RepID=UPI002236075B|nr:zona pellucida sperm-binding protein 1 [Antechinus flavipes]
MALPLRPPDWGPFSGEGPRAPGRESRPRSLQGGLLSSLPQGGSFPTVPSPRQVGASPGAPALLLGQTIHIRRPCGSLSSAGGGREPVGRLGAGGLAMGGGKCWEFLLLATLGLFLGQTPGAGGLQHRLECGSYSMQLLVFPRPGRMIRFKVVDEFGTAFEVTNCSICLHWISSKPQGPAIFSAGYHGCHVTKKDDQYHLRVFVEEMLGAHVDETRVVTLICPRPAPPNTLGAPLPHPSPASFHPHPRLPSPPHPIHPEWRRPSLPPVADRTRPPARIQPTWPRSSGRGSPVHQIFPPQPGQDGLPAIPRDPPSQERCRVGSGRLPCAEGASPEACLRAGCCFDHTDEEIPCFYGNTATVQCSEDGHFILVLSRNMTSAKQVSLESIRLAYASDGCAPTQRTRDFVVFRFLVTQCGTSTQLVNNQLVYENQLVADVGIQTGPEGAITRDSTYLLHARCIYNVSNFLPLQLEVFLPSPPAPVLGSGPLHLELRIAKNEKYGSYYHVEDFPIFKTLREPIHVEVRLLRRTDPHLVLVLHHCWATPSTNPFKEPQWPLLFDGCPFSGDGYKTQLVPKNISESPFPTHYQRFIVATFTFVDSASQRALGGPVYFFCSASACYPSETETCRTVCRPGATKQRRFVDEHNDMESAQDIVGSPGPVAFGGPREQKITLQNESSSMEADPKGRAIISRPNVSEPHLPEGSSWNTIMRPLLWVTLCLVVITVFLVVAALLGRGQKLQEQNRECEQGQ